LKIWHANLIVPHQLGMTTVLVVPDGTRDVVREDWELEAATPPCRSCHRRSDGIFGGLTLI